MGEESRQASAARAGVLAGRYRLGPLLGRGGAGVVYEALDVTLGRRVAVKVFQADGTATGRYRFAAEARLLAGLSHPGLVTVHDVGLDGDEPFLVMHLVDGPTLREVLDRGPIDPVPVARIGARLADVLAYIHAHDIVHRDIKPSNVLLDEHGDCHLADFGVARALSAIHLTTTGEFVGTAAYLAPEQVTDIEVGPGADIYALGLLLLECLTGVVEYHGTTVETALARLHRPPRIPGELPASWRSLLTAMTARDPATRPDATHCADVLRAIANGRTAALGVATVPGPRQPEAIPGRSRPPRSRPVHAGLTALALTAVCAIAAAGTTAVPGRPAGDPNQPAPAGRNTPTISESAATIGPAEDSRVNPPPVTPTPPATTGPPHPGTPKQGGPGKGHGKGKGKN